MEGIIFLDRFIPAPDTLFTRLTTTVDWDERMSARKTASYGVAYNYSQMSYPFREFLPELAAITKQLANAIGFEPNNCLINYYADGRSKMGYHSDQTDILEPGTGIAIISLGDTRVLAFRNIADQEKRMEYPLPAGSLIYMTQEIQEHWQHAIPRSDSDKGRISLTFRKIK